MGDFRFQISDFRLARRACPARSARRVENQKSQIKTPLRPAFTMTELLIVMLILSIMAAMTLAVVAGATNMAREQRTRAIINKLDQLVMERYESYRTRAVPLNFTRRRAAYAPNVQTGIVSAGNRLNGIRELMRMELPDRRTDIISFTTNPPSLQVGAFVPNAALQKSYFRSAVRALGGQNNLSNWTTEYESSECLFLIVSSMQDGDKNASDYFLPEEIGDLDNDGMKEIWDSWGQPILFCRWPAGFTRSPGPDLAWGNSGTDDDNNGVTDDISEMGYPGSDDVVPLTSQTLDYVNAPDPFDPVKVDPQWSSTTFKPYLLKPLIFSAGRDKIYDIDLVPALIYSASSPPNDPYYSPNATTLPNVGRPAAMDGDGTGNVDNITNHYQQTP